MHSSPKRFTSTKTCRFCHEEFELVRGKPGRIDVCTEQACQRQDRKEAREPEMVKGWTAWEGKHTPVLTITSAGEANRINGMLKRRGHFPCLPVGNYSTEHDKQVMAVTGVERQYTAIEQERKDVVR